MKKLGKILLIVLGSLVVLLAIAITFTIGWRPFIGPSARATSSQPFERTPQRLARGEYLVTSILDCNVCHSPKDWNTHGAPNLPGKMLGGQIFPIPDLPGQVVAPNISPDPETGAGKWTDDQIARSIREGIAHDGHAIFPMMPYNEYSHLSDEDVKSVVVYLRSIPPVHSALPPTKLIFPVKYLINGAPQPLTHPVSGPDPSDQIQRGKYLATLGCGCHTPTDRGKVLPGLQYGGGEHLKGPWGDVTSANITRDASGIGYYDEAMFIHTLRTGYVGARKLNSIMPFGSFKNLNDDDLKAIFAYLRSVPPAKHRVDNTLPPTYCKICKQWHGGGDQN